MGILAGRGFGLFIAYVIPGFVALIGISTVSPPVADWLFGAGENGPSIGGVVYLLIAAVAAGMTASAFRWLVLDSLLAWRGLKRPLWDDGDLWRRQQAYELLIEIHYRYYQFYGHSVVTMPFAWVLAGYGRAVPLWSGLVGLVLVVVFTLAANDALGNYYRRVTTLLLSSRSNDHDKRRSPRHRRRGIKTDRRQRRHRERTRQAEREHTGRS
jgi:hypothetical protein